MRDARGNAAIIFALTLTPLISLTGAGVDYSRASSVRIALQAAVDGALLAVGREAITSSEEELSAKARIFFLENFHPRVPTTAPALQFTRSGTTISLAAEASVGTTFMALLGMSVIPVAAAAEVTAEP